MKFNLSKHISPKEDFYQYVNNEWVTNTTIPDDKNRIGTFDIITENNNERIKRILESKYSNNEYNKVTILHKSYMNESRNKINPISFVREFLNKIKLISTKDELLDLMYKDFSLYGLDTPVNFSVFNDFKDSNLNILHVSTGGLGLPDQSYYFDKDKYSQRVKYVSFIKSYLKIFNLDFNYKEIYKLEKLLAKNTYTNVESRNPDLMNNVLSYNEFQSRYSDINIDKIFKLLNVKPGKINIINLKFLKNGKDGFIDIWNCFSLKLWKEYITWLYLRQIGSYINIYTEESLFNFYQKELAGTINMKPKWKRSISYCEDYVGMIIGKIYVEKYFNSDSKEKVIEMIKFIKQNFKNRFKTNKWMTEETKLKAIEKLNKINFKIGYPNKWRDYTDLIISSKNSFLQNILNCKKFETKFDNSFLYKEVDKSLWFMNPQDVNAYYSPSYNEIVFPAGILQDPFFSIKNDIALNFGGIGTVIAHELTHAFDDQGKKYDSDGNLNEWWNEQDDFNYKKLTNKLSKLFSSYKIYDQNVNGELTLGENIADLGGVTVSYNSLISYLKLNLKEDVMIDNLNQKERFFINYANIWKSKIKKKEAIKRLTTDPHSPPEYRVNGILAHLKDFDETFNIKNSSEKITIF